MTYLYSFTTINTNHYKSKLIIAVFCKKKFHRDLKVRNAVAQASFLLPAS